ncbi:MAG: tRNA guanosine(34) transglycosylase Tgt [Saprospiraceae bacterium]|nr:tRNA guanosine(34) transglycosylase Tgt [Saprospiraceae bacterium]
MDFSIAYSCRNTSARTGLLNTGHGLIETPTFMPVGTQGTVKSLNQHQLLHDIGAQIILGNTYHLYLRPGLEVIETAGGLHNFIAWPRPLLTDSGGYQVYSLSDRRKISEEGVTFSSHIDGSRHTFTPERAIEIQRIIGADIIMAFDECTPFPCDRDYASKSLELTHRWLDRCITYFDNGESRYGYDQILVPIVQGSTYEDLRTKSASFVSELDTTIAAIGGLSVGEPSELLYNMTDLVCQILPRSSARYLMGVGTPADLLHCISLGVDMFDCVLPTRNGRHGLIYTTKGLVNIKNRKWQNSTEPIDEHSPIELLRSHSKSYLRHLIISKEMLGAQLASMQNLSFYSELMKTARNMIREDRFNDWKDQMLEIVTTKI